GVPGVGKEQTLKLIETLRGQNLLQRFEQWKEQFQNGNNPPMVAKRVIHCSECHHPGSYEEHEHSGCKFCESTRYCKPNDSKYCCPCEWHHLERVKQASAVEDNIRKKAISCEGFPFSEVIQEFLVNKNKLVKIKEYQRPSLLSFQIFASEKMEWPKHYACKKLITLLTRYDMIQRKSGYIDSKQLQAIRIVKTRVKNGVPCFEIEWQKPEHYVDAEDEPAELFLVTVEEESLFQAAYPDVVALYQVENSEALKKKHKNWKDRPKEKQLPNVYDEVSNLLSQMNLKSTCEILSVQDSMTDLRIPLEDQIQQRSTESKDPVLPAASCITTIQMPVSATALPLAALPYSLLKNTLAKSSVLPAQYTKNLGVSSFSSVTGGPQLSSIDREVTTLSAMPPHAKGAHETVRNSSEYSDAMQSEHYHSNSADDLISNGAIVQPQKWSLSEQILKKPSIPSKPLLSENVMQVKSLKCFKQTKETLNNDKNYASSSSQLNNLVQESKNAVSENYAGQSSIRTYQCQYKKADSLDEMVQKDHNTNSSTSLALSGQIKQTLHPGCEILPVSQKLAEVVTGCRMKKACTQTTWKMSYKKSVCQDRCSSSEESDDENMKQNVISEQQRSQLNPIQFKKCFTKKNDAVTSKRTNSDSALIIKENKKKANLKKAGNSLSLQVSPKPSSVGEVNCFQNLEQLFDRSGSGPTQQTESALLTYAWTDSPLPLSERLKGRIKIN
ncbi:GEN endonuclease, partial [Geococcyx californianus]|nr:GEN endonuclease [Geococcyx californianus]